MLTAELHSLVPDVPLGGHRLADGTIGFCVWAPAAPQVLLTIDGRADGPMKMQPAGAGYHTLRVDAESDVDYGYDLGDGRVLPDPASRHQPHGVHGLSRVVASSFDWQIDAWSPPELDSMLIYELHVGTFTAEGTFDAVRARLPALRDLGVTSIELMPVAQFPGARNWGYDGVFPFAAQHSYGGPAGLKRLVDAAHALDITIVLDVVYNHLGPEGNYLNAYGPYFTDTYTTPWGSALNFDGADSDHVRRFFIDSALQWIDEFRIDALRLDAVHAIFDASARPFLRELAAAVHGRAEALQRRAIVIAESDLGDPRMLRSGKHGGYDMDAQWLDDFHHALRTLLTHEKSGYYLDFGSIDHFARALHDGFVYTGQFSSYRRRRHGAPAPDLLPRQFVVYGQNHDQVGNRVTGDRPSRVLTAAQLRLMAAAVLLSPFTPMLFMGEEYGETSPFPYFVSHGDSSLIESVRAGRREEFATFAWKEEPPDPQAEETFASARLDWAARDRPVHHEILDWYSHLIRLRSSTPALRGGDSRVVRIFDRNGNPSAGQTREGVVVLRRDAGQQSSLLFLSFCDSAVSVSLDAGADTWVTALDSAATEWGGAGSVLPALLSGAPMMSIEIGPFSAVLLLREANVS